MLRHRLVQLRKEFNKTQSDIAKVLEITRPAYTAYEKGSRNPDYETLDKLANYFEVTTDYLLGRSDNRNMTEKDEEFEEGKTAFKEKHGLNDLSKESREFARRYENLTQEQRDEIERILEWEEYKKSRGE